MRRRGFLRLMVLAAGVLLCTGPTARATDATWNLDGDGVWMSAANWTPQAVPNGVGDVARLDTFLTDPVTITLNQLVPGEDPSDVVLGALLIKAQGGMNYTLEPYAYESLIFDTASGDARILGFGQHTFSVPVQLNDSLTVENTYEGTLDLLLFGPLSGNAGKALTVDGVWTHVTLTAAANPLKGPVVVGPGENAFALTELATATQVTGFEAHLGSYLALDNSLDSVNDRVSAPVSLYGGGLTFQGNPGQACTEVLPNVTLATGSSVIEAWPFGGPAALATLNMTILGRARGATVLFTGDDLGGTCRIVITPPGGLTLDHGILGGWAVVDGTDFAAVDIAGGTGVKPLATYQTNINAALFSSNVALSASATLTASRNINSLKVSDAPTLDLAGFTLNIESGGLLLHWPGTTAAGGGAVPLDGTGTPALITGGRLTAGASTAGTDLIVHVYDDIEIAAAVVNNPGGAIGLTASGLDQPWWSTGPVLTLSGANTYTGPTTINSCIVSIDAAERLGTGALTLTGGTLRATGTAALAGPVTLNEAAAFEVAADQVLTLAGSISGSVTELYLRTVAAGTAGVTRTDTTGAGTVVLGAANGFRGDIVVGTGYGVAMQGGGRPAPRYDLDATGMTILQVGQDANFGVAGDQGIYLDGGILHVTGTFAPDPARVFVVDLGGAAFDIDDGQVFTLGSPGQLEGEGSAVKMGLGMMALPCENPYFMAERMLVGEGTLELRHPGALNEVPITLSGGTLSLVADVATLFPHYVGVFETSVLRVAGPGAGNPVLSVNSLHLEEGAALTIAGENGYRFAVEEGVAVWGNSSLDVQAPTRFNNFYINVVGSTVTKTGPETLTIGGDQWHTGGARLSAVAGAIDIHSDAGDPGAGNPRNLTVEAAGPGAAVRLNVTQHLAGVALAGGGRISLAAGGSRLLVTEEILFAEDVTGVPQGVLDLAEHGAIVDYAEGDPNPAVALGQWIRSGSNGGTWDGPGILSSAAATEDRQLTAIGLLDNTDPKVGGKTEFAGEEIDASSILLKYTWWGDANLDGIVDANDYDVIDRNYLFMPHPEAPWFTGDFDYDGVIDANDYDRIDKAYLFQSGPLAGAGAAAPAATPEPATLALVALGALGLLGRKKR